MPLELGGSGYLDERGELRRFSAVVDATMRLVDRGGGPVGYLPPEGSRELVESTRDLVVPASLLDPAEVAGAQALGGLGGISLAGALLSSGRRPLRVHVPAPGNPLYADVLGSLPSKVRTYPYPEPRNLFRRQRMLEALDRLGSGDLALLPGCCPDPTGLALEVDEWRVLADSAGRRGWVPLVLLDGAGLGLGLERDLDGVRVLATSGVPFVTVISFSKMMSLYGERVGVVLAVSAGSSRKIEQRLQSLARARWGSPPQMGAAIACMVLRDPMLTGWWQAGLERARARVQQMRSRLYCALEELRPDLEPHRWMEEQGLFGFTGLDVHQVSRLAREKGVHLARSGRINYSGLNSANVERATAALAEVV